ncbi:MAG TPA: hypothetical protein VMG41_14515 [Gemmatimonadales bacterium]|nr:hypothetical protein [Gemmatimonadales bacterium]
MTDTLIGWLGGAGTWAWHVSAWLLLAVNLGALGIVVITRSRALVDRWTGRWLAANLGLLGFGLGVPAVTGLLRLALNALPSLGVAQQHLPK